MFPYVILIETFNTAPNSQYLSVSIRSPLELNVPNIFSYTSFPNKVWGEKKEKTKILQKHGQLKKNAAMSNNVLQTHADFKKIKFNNLFCWIMSKISCVVHISNVKHVRQTPPQQEQNALLTW